MLDDLKKRVCKENLRLQKSGLVILTEGNASQISDDRKYMVIKPSGVPYESLTPEKMVVLDMNGNIIEGKLKPSSDTPTHLEIYKKFEEVGGIVHTHSLYATMFAQMKKPIECFGTTHADAFYGDVPVTRHLTEEEINAGYELHTGKVISEVLQLEKSPCVLVASHGPFAFGGDAKQAVDYAYILEKVAMMAHMMAYHGATQEPLPQWLLDKHFNRKHGKDRYYGQGTLKHKKTK